MINTFDFVGLEISEAHRIIKESNLDLICEIRKLSSLRRDDNIKFTKEYIIKQEITEGKLALITDCFKTLTTI